MGQSTQLAWHADPLVEALAALAPGGLVLGLERREGPQRQRVPVGQRLGEARRLVAREEERVGGARVPSEGGAQAVVRAHLGQGQGQG